MTRDFGEVLQQAMEFYVAGQIVEARALLLDVVRADPNVEAGWMFLSYTLDDPNRKADCLRKVLAINPQNAEARAELEKIETSIKAEAKPAPQTGQLEHASPFTVDIDHANDDISVFEKEAGPAPEPAAASAAVPRPAPTPPKKEQSPAVTAAPGPAAAPAQVPRPPQPAPKPPKQAALSAEVAKASKPTAAFTTPPFPAAPAAGRVAASPGTGSPPIAGQPVKPSPRTASAKIDAKQPEQQEEVRPKKKRSLGCTCLIAVVVLLMVGGLAGVGLWQAGYLPADLFGGGNPPTAAQTAEPVDTPVQFVLPSEWTDTPVPTVTLTPTVTSTPTVTPTPSLIPPDPDMQAAMEKIIKQVSDLRGLQMQETPPIYVVTVSEAEAILQAEYERLNYRATIEKEEKAMIALGFIKPTYDLSKYALERLADGVGGFYMPSNKTVYVIGSRFGGMEKYIFSHEYDHALVHSNFPDSMAMETDPICANDSQRCEAIRALVEGDATIIMDEWWNLYATAYDMRDIYYYHSPFILPPEDNTPPYMLQSLIFTYNYGSYFVDELRKKGNWALVDKAYKDLPVSTEQILNPEKYISGEKPIAMKVPDLQKALGDQWTLIKSDNLGEYMTYLLLAYGADNLSQITPEKAVAAADGWGGDHYQVYAHASGGDQLVLAAEWAWDQNKDATEFLARMIEYLGMRFRGNKTGNPASECWSMNDITTCVFHSGKNILWILAPDAGAVTSVKAAYKY
jgi:hypothetical protein